MSTLQPLPKALIFDVFGTVVDWRTTVVDGLHTAASTALSDKNTSIPEHVRQKATSLGKSDWADFAQAWRSGYMEFCRSLANDPDKEWKSVDQHHYDSLKELVDKWDLRGLWAEQEILDLSLIWHRLRPWDDSVEGLRALHGKFKTATLSNGNATLLEDLVKHGDIAFDHVFSCEQFKTYKPNPKTYRGAMETLGFEPGECAMVAAHLFDLQAAKKCGMKTIYIARPKEEEYDQATIDEVRQSDTVDIWIEENEHGILSVVDGLGGSH